MDFLWHVHECELSENNTFGRVTVFYSSVVDQVFLSTYEAGYFSYAQLSELHLRHQTEVS